MRHFLINEKCTCKNEKIWFQSKLIGVLQFSAFYKHSKNLTPKMCNFIRISQSWARWITRSMTKEKILPCNKRFVTSIREDKRQIVMVTFVQLTYILVPFVHISIISTVTDPILTKLLVPNFRGPTSFWPEYFLDQKKFWQKIWWIKIRLT